MKKLPDEYFDRVFMSDDIDICFACGKRMTVTEGGERICSDCHISFLPEEREEVFCEWEDQLLMELGYYGEDDDDDNDDIPEGCAACGGPWPDCETSCNIFDD